VNFSATPPPIDEVFTACSPVLFAHGQLLRRRRSSAAFEEQCMRIPYPTLLFLGAGDDLAAKTAHGIRYWRPDWCLGQIRLPGGSADLRLPDLTPGAAAKLGAKSLIIGVANPGGYVPEEWLPTLTAALEAGLDIAAGLHDRLNEIAALSDRAQRLGRSLFDVRHPPGDIPVGNGRKRSGRRLLTVGTDCSVGKMFTSLALERELRSRGVNADFRATGQTGIFIAGSGIAVDAVVSDFVAGAAETLSPANDANHWDLIEGQGSLFHPAYAGVTMGLIHGSQPDALVLCHAAGRARMDDSPDYELPQLEETLDLNLRVARRTNPSARFVGVAINTSALDQHDASSLLADTQAKLGLPCCDPVRTGVANIVDHLLG
jgi:uncharacterized NAD-dependent epimerase/dehydratase family protein